MSDVSIKPPALRPGVFVDSAGGAAALVDAIFTRRVKLDEAGLAIASGLAQGHGLEALAEAAQTSPQHVTTWLSRLEALDLLDTPRARARANDRSRLQAVKASPLSHLRPLPGARFSCTMCGSCCGGHVVGPVTPNILAGLEPHLALLSAEVKAERRVDKGLFFVLPSQRATPGEDVVCHASGGSCVFLDDRGLCRIHGKLGGDKKPLPCRIFPWELVATPTGVRAAIQRECRDFFTATAEDKPMLEEAHDELVALLREIPGLWSPSTTPVLRGQKLDAWDDYERLEAHLLESAAMPAPARRVFGALAADLGPAAESVGDLIAWRDTLVAPVRQILQAVPASDDEVVFRVDALSLLAEGLAEARGWLLARVDGPLVEGEERLLSSHLQHGLWSLSHLRATSIEAGVARMHAEWFLARVFAVLRAREVKRFHITLQDLQDGLATAAFLFRHRDLTPLLDQLDPLTTSVFLDHTDTLVASADLERDGRTELPKF